MMLASGTLLGRYRLQNPIGSGSAGDVYQAEEVQNGRQVALKVLRIELPLDIADESIQLFRREAAQIADLQHTHILPLLDFGNVVVDDTMLFYTITQPYKGETLDTWLQQRGSSAYLSLADVVTLLQPIADALDYAHNQQVVHQAIRPTNLLVRSRNNSALPDLLLTDFSFASLHRTIPDTPSYVAPEQWAGTSVAATDQYSLATVAYRLLTGNTPFQGTSEQVKQQQLNAIPRPVSESSTQLHKDVDTVLLMGLAKEPQRRFPSVSAFIDALEQTTQQRETPEAVTLPAQPILASAQRSSASRPLEQTVLPQPISLDTDSTQQTLIPAQLQSPTAPSAAPQQLPLPLTTRATLAKKVATSVSRRDSALMNILSLLLLTIIIIASSLGILIKQQNDQPSVHATATADIIRSQNSDIFSYIPGQNLLVYDPLSNNNTSWTPKDSRLGTCNIFSLSKVLNVTTSPSTKSTATSKASKTTTTPPPNANTASDDVFHSCVTTDYNYLFSGSNVPNNVIIEVQVQFDKQQTSTGGIIFSQIESDQSEKFFVFSISSDGKYGFCPLDSSKEMCRHLPPPYSLSKTASKPSPEEFNRIAVVISGNVCHLYLKKHLLSQEDIQLEQNGASQVAPINSVGVVASVPPTDDSARNESVDLSYRNLKIWKA